MQPSPPRTRNILLDRLSAADFAFLKPSLERVSLREAEVLLEAYKPIDYLCFPESGIASVHEIFGDGSRVGVGIIGMEGLTGWPALLGADHSPHEASVAIGGGTAFRISTADLLAACAARPTLLALFLRYVQCFLNQMGRTILSNLHDPVERRLGRWLLMNHDRLEGDEIRLTHEQLGVMLGVRRASVTDTLHILQGEGLILSRRGVLTIRDRDRLVAFAGEAYGVAEAEYARLIAPFGKTR